MKRKRPIVIGSISFDVIFSVHNEFKKEIIVKDSQVSDITMMLTANKKQVFFGGTAGNIAYGLGIQGYEPVVISAGKDFIGEFNTHLVNNGVDTRVKIFEKEYTATFYAISDKLRDQIGIFQPNAHEYIEDLDLTDFITEKNEFGVAICSPGTGKSILRHAKQIREMFGKQIKLIADPSQILSIFFTGEDMKQLLNISDIFIGNEVEIEQLKKLLDCEIADLFRYGLEAVIETKGAKGCVVYYPNKDGVKLDAFKVDNFLEATGAGDAFRSGFIGGLLDNKEILEAAEQGMQVAARSVQYIGGQTYKL
ncbi:MAG: carbohydrate kinase family protein [Candidatus Dojkabacteria bacterium]